MRRNTRTRTLKGNRILYGIIFLSSLFFHLFWSNNLTALIFYSIVLLPLCSLLLTILFFYRFRYSQRLSVKEVVKFEPFEYSVWFDNRDPVHYHPLKINYYSSNLIESEKPFPEELQIRPLNNHLIRFKCTGRCRGEFSIGIKNLQMTDYLNLFTFSFKRRDNLKIRVLPRKVFLKNCFLQDSESSKAVRCQQNLINKKDEINHFRPYVAGDSLRKIHWKKSAQKGEFIIRHNEAQRSRKVCFILDQNRYANETNELLMQEDILIETCLALGLYFLRKNYLLEILISGKKKRICYNGKSYRDQFYRDLALIPFQNDLPLPSLKNKKPEETVLFCFTSRLPAPSNPIYSIFTKFGTTFGNHNFLVYPIEGEEESISFFKEKSILHIPINPALNIKNRLETLRI